MCGALFSAALSCPAGSAGDDDLDALLGPEEDYQSDDEDDSPKAVPKRKVSQGLVGVFGRGAHKQGSVAAVTVDCPAEGARVFSCAPPLLSCGLLQVGRPLKYKGDPNAPHLTEEERRRIKR